MQADLWHSTAAIGKRRCTWAILAAGLALVHLILLACGLDTPLNPLVAYEQGYR
jgi:hypothetical protein